MILFIKKGIVFLIPLILFYVFPIFVIFVARENLSLKRIVDIQKSNIDAIYGDAYTSDSFVPYKRMLVESNSPDVIVLGTSRSLELRKEFFASTTRFINAGMAGRSIKDMDNFVRTMSTHTASTTIILVLDQDLLLRGVDEGDRYDEGGFSLFGMHQHIPLEASRGIYMDYFLRHKYTFKELFEQASLTHSVGLTALMYGNGFRSDGSYRYYQEIQDTGRIERNKVAMEVQVKNIKASKDRLSNKQKKNLEENSALLQDMLIFCGTHGVHVIGITPPYPHTMYMEMFQHDNMYHDLMFRLPTQLKNIFSLQGMTFYDLSDISLYGGRDAEFIDPVHGTDLLYARMALYLASNDATFGAKVSSSALRELIKNSQGNFLNK